MKQKQKNGKQLQVRFSYVTFNTSYSVCIGNVQIPYNPKSG